MTKTRQRYGIEKLIKLRREILSGQIAPIYLLYPSGKERNRDNFQFISSLISAMLIEALKEKQKSSYSIHICDEQQQKLQSVLSSASCLPMFGERKLIIYRTGKNLSRKELNQLAEYLKSPSPMTTLFTSFLSSKLPEEILNEAESKGVCVEFTSPSEKETKKWIKEIFTEERFQITAEAIEKILEIAGTNLQVIEDAKNKLILYTYDEGRIDAHSVEKLLLPSRQVDIYEFVERLMEKNIPEALRAVEKLENQKVEPIFIGAVMAQQFRQLLKIKIASAKDGKTTEEIAEATGLRNFVIRKLVPHASRFSVRDIEKSLKICIEINTKIKSSRKNPYRIIEDTAIRIMGR